MTLTRMLQTFTLQQISLACSHPVASMFIGEAYRLKLIIMDNVKSKDVIFAQSCKKDNHIAHRSIDNFECACLLLKKYVSVVKLRSQLFSNSVLEIKKRVKWNNLRGNSTKTKTFEFNGFFCGYLFSNELDWIGFRLVQL